MDYSQGYFHGVPRPVDEVLMSVEQAVQGFAGYRVGPDPVCDPA